MKNGGIFLLLLIVLMVMGGCGKVINEDQLIGGKWVGTSGYADEEISGEPVCPPFEKGLEFKDEETVYVESEEKDFTYRLRESDEGMEIEFYNPNGEVDFFTISMEDNDGFGLNGSGMIKTTNCYFEREDS